MADPINTVGDMLSILQGEIEDLKADTLTESKARIIAKFRSLQLKTAEIAIQYNRMMRAKKIGGENMPLLGPAPAEATK